MVRFEDGHELFQQGDDCHDRRALYIVLHGPPLGTARPQQPRALSNRAPSATARPQQPRALSNRAAPRARKRAAPRLENSRFRNHASARRRY